MTTLPFLPPEALNIEPKDRENVLNTCEQLWDTICSKLLKVPRQDGPVHVNLTIDIDEDVIGIVNGSRELIKTHQRIIGRIITDVAKSRGYTFCAVSWQQQNSMCSICLKGPAQ